MSETTGADASASVGLASEAGLLRMVFCGCWVRSMAMRVRVRVTTASECLGLACSLAGSVCSHQLTKRLGLNSSQ